MNKVKKILNISNLIPAYKDHQPVAVSVGNIRHTEVHSHKECAALEVVMCLQGKLGIYCNEDRVTLKGGEIFTINYDDVHCLYSDEDNLTMTVHFDLKALDVDEELFVFPYLTCDDILSKPFQKEYIQQVKCLVLSLAYRMLRGTIKDDEIHNAASEIIDYLSDKFDWLNVRESYVNYNEELNSRLRNVVKQCTDNYQEKLTAEKLANDIHINRSYFSQFFKKSPFGGFNKMLGYIRCLNAQTLLISSEMTITEISVECGFSDEKYFYKNFKHFWHCTPSEYRAWYSDYVKLNTENRYLTEDETMMTLTPYVADFLSNTYAS